MPGAREFGERLGGGAPDRHPGLGDATVGRSDADIHVDVRKVMNASDKTRLLRSEVNDGRVTIITSPGVEDDLSTTISQIRKVSGVKSVMVITR